MSQQIKNNHQQILTCLHTPEEILYLVNKVFSEKNLINSDTNKNILPIITTRLKPSMKSNIKPLSVFIINNMCIRRWTDGYKWHEPSPGDFWSITAQIGIKKKFNSIIENNESINLFTNSNELNDSKNKIKENYLKKFYNQETLDYNFLKENEDNKIFEKGLIKKSCKFYYENDPYTIIVYTTIDAEITKSCCKKYYKMKFNNTIENMKQFRFLSTSFFNKLLFDKEDKNVLKFLYQFSKSSSTSEIKKTDSFIDDSFLFDADGSILSEEVSLDRNNLLNHEYKVNDNNNSKLKEFYTNNYLPNLNENEIKWFSNELINSSKFDIPILKISKGYFNDKKEKTSPVKIVRPENHFKNR